MSETLTTLHEKIASLVDQSVIPPTVGGSEWNVRTTFINRSIKEWAEAYDWEALRVKTAINTSGVSGATLSLPTNFKKMAEYPVYYDGTNSTGVQYPEIQPNQTGLQESTDKYYYILGNPGNGFTAIWNPGTLVSGASIAISYYKQPTELSAITDVTECPNPEFIIDRAMAYIFEARSDARFQEMEAKAREKLLQMVDNENVKSAAYLNDIKTPERLYYNFRIGKN